MGLDVQLVLPLAGLVAGVVLGYVARVNRFCTLGALERLWYVGDAAGVRTWVLAAATAIAATQALALAGFVDPGASFYLSPEFGLTGALLGGVMFGFGMALVGTCGFGAVLRLGGGSLRSLVVLLVLGLSALAAQRGLAGQLRVVLVDGLALDLSFAGDQSLGSLASAMAGVDLRAAVALAVVAALAWWVFRDARYRRDRRQIAAGTTIGLVIAFGWLATSYGAAHAFAPVELEAGSFVMPVGELLLGVIAVTGEWPGYGVGLVAGTLVGAALGAWRRHDVRWEACDDARELGRHLVGGALMGIGGVFALGCTIGQGVTAASALAVSAPVVVVAMAFGARLGLAWLLEGSVLAAFRRVGGVPAE